MATQTRILPAMDRKMTSDRKMPAAGKHSSLQSNQIAYAYRKTPNVTVSDNKYYAKRIILNYRKFQKAVEHNINFSRYT
jgi:hypothetical protein